MEREKKTLGILLKKTFLANDDAVLEFFTAQFGRLPVFVPKFAKSKKKAGEIEFFRLLELEIFEGRHSAKLKSARTLSVFHGWEISFARMEEGFLWYDTLARIVPESKPTEDFFAEMVKIMGHVEEDSFEKISAFFWVKIFCFLGVCPRFDTLRGDVFFHPETAQFSRENRSGFRAMDNNRRQILEFLRRSSFEVFWEKRNRLEQKTFPEIHEVLERFRQTHL